MKKGMINRKSQITAFVIIGIIIVLLIVGIFYFIRKTNNPGNSVTSSTTLSEATENLQQARDKCISSLAIEALDDNGLQDQSVKEKLESDFENCINPLVEPYKKFFIVQTELNSINVSINNQEIVINVDYPITITKQNSSNKVKSNVLAFQRVISKNIKHDSNCIITEDIGLVSFDEKFDIQILKGTKATNAGGTCLDNISIELKDPVIDYGGREKSYTSIAYVPEPIGARFDKEVRIKLKYTNKDYIDYSEAAAKINSYIIPETWMKMQYYDLSSNNFYVYPSKSNVSLDTDTDKKIMTSKVYQFYGLGLARDDTCKILKTTIVESPDRRVQLKIDAGTKATNADGSCVSEIEIKEGPKTSKVVNFGDRDYELLPEAATFSPDITYTYRYSQQQIQNPVFLYGNKNWQNLITDNWTAPINASNTRLPSDLRIAYDDNGVYRPWPTQVDEKNKLIIAQINHFSFSIPAQGCNDIANAIMVLSYIEDNGNCTGQIGASPSQSATSYLINNQEACFDKNTGFTITYQTSAGDTQGTIVISPEDKTSVGWHSITETTLQESNGQAATAINGASVCAYTELYLTAKGIGVTSNADLSGCLSGNCEGDIINLSNICTGARGGSMACFNPAICDSQYTGELLEGCYACVRMATTEGNPEGKTLDYCTHAVVGEGGASGEWGAENCQYSGCKQEACLKCAEWAETDPGSIGSKATMSSLEHCADVIEHECGGSGGEINAPVCTANTGNYKSSAGLAGYGLTSGSKSNAGWNAIDPVELANQMSANNLTLAYVEFLADQYDPLRTPAVLFPKLKAFVEAMRAKNITTMINMVHGKLKDEQGDYICKNAFDDAYFNNILNFMITEIGSDKVILQANHEWVSGCQDKRDKWINVLLNSAWTGGKSSYMVARGTQYYLEVHPDPGQDYPSGALVTMDNGETLKMVSIDHNGWVEAVPSKLQAYAQSVIQCGSGVVYYGFGQTSIDSGAIQALGAAKAAVNSA